jgi:hypothetical protein
MDKQTASARPEQPPGAEEQLLKGPASDPIRLTKAEAQVLRDQLSSFAEDWEATGMEAYDNL